MNIKRLSFTASVILLLCSIAIPLGGQIMFWRTIYSTGCGQYVLQNLDSTYVIAGWRTYNDNTSDFILIKTDVDGYPIWTKTYGGSNNEGCYSVTKTPDKGYLMVGYTYSFGVNPGTHSNIYLIKTDSLGDSIWTKTYGGIDNDVGFSVMNAIDSGFVISGYTYIDSIEETDAYFLKIDAAGSVLWEKVYGDTFRQGASAIAHTKDSGYILAGRSGRWLDLVYLLKTDSLGDSIWATNPNPIGSWDWPKSILQTPDGGYVFPSTGAAVKLTKADSLGNFLWTEDYYYGNAEIGSHYVQNTLDSNFILTGFREHYYGPYDPNNNDLCLVKADTSGQCIWKREYQTTSQRYETGYCVQPTLDGGYIITGNGAYRGRNILLVKTDSLGTGINEYCNGATTLFTHLLVLPKGRKIEISFSASNDGNVTIELFDLCGRNIATLFDGYCQTGKQQLTWDGRTQRGTYAPSGIYFCRLRTGDRLQTVKFVYMR